MRLIELDPQLYRREIREDGHEWHIPVSTRDEADGIQFLCPKCFEVNKGTRGTHSVICWRPHVPQDVKPGPGRWEIEGELYDGISLVNPNPQGARSVLLLGGCGAHFFVTAGLVELC